MTVSIVQLESCPTTQEEVRRRLADGTAGDCVAVASAEQQAGRGREGRVWENPSGQALMVSVGRRGPLPVTVLEELPRRVAQAVVAVLATQLGESAGSIEWKAPNDLVERSSGAKIAGILVDTRTTANEVDEVIVGLGLNLTGEAFLTSDGRTATTVEQACGTAPDEAQMLRFVVDSIERELHAL